MPDPGQQISFSALLLFFLAVAASQAARDTGELSRPQAATWSGEDRQMALEAAVVDALDQVDEAMAAGRYSRALELLLQLETALPGSSTLANNIGCVYAEMDQ